MSLWPVCLSWLKHCPINWPRNCKVMGSIPCQGTCLGCRFGPWLGYLWEATNQCFSHQSFFSSLSPSFPLFLKSISMSSDEDFKKLCMSIIANLKIKIHKRKKKNKRVKITILVHFFPVFFSIYTCTHLDHTTYIITSFCKGPDSECFWTCRPRGPCQLCCCSGERNGWGCVPIKLHLQKQETGFGFPLLIPVLYY